MFVVFEGIDGSGKTTISNLVADELAERGHSVAHLRAKGKFVSAAAEAIRELGRDARNVGLTPQAEFLLYLARDVQLLHEALLPALEHHDVVFADRFLHTAEVLGRYGRDLPREWSDPILRAAAQGIEPDLVVLMDVDPFLARARRKAAKLEAQDRQPPSRKGLAGAALQHRLRAGYLELARERSRWVVIENDNELSASVERVTELVALAGEIGADAAIERFRSGATPGARSAPPAAPALASPSRALAAFLGWIDARSADEPKLAAYLLGGLHGAGIDERRQALSARVPRLVLAGLSGLDDEVSFRLRQELAAGYPGEVARTLSGVAALDARAPRLRALLAERAPAEVLMSYAGLDDEAAWSARERGLEAHPSAVVAGLGGLDGERAWRLRERFLELAGDRFEQDYELARALCRSLSGLEDELAWRLRWRARVAAPVAALASLAGLTSERAWDWRARYLASAPKAVMGTLRRLSAARAWEMRREVAAFCKEAIDSLHSLGEPEAWELREAQADAWPSTVVKSLGPLADEPRGQALLSRQLARHPGSTSLLKHASAIALGLHRGRPFREE